MRNSGAAAAAVLVATLLVSGCGGGSDSEDSRPSADDVSGALESGKATDLGLAQRLPEKAAACVARTLVASELSDKALRSIVDKDKQYRLTKADEKALTPIIGDLRTCLQDVEPSK